MSKDEKLKPQINQSIYEKKNYKQTLKTKNKKIYIYRQINKQQDTKQITKLKQIFLHDRLQYNFFKRLKLSIQQNKTSGTHKKTKHKPNYPSRQKQ